MKPKNLLLYSIFLLFLCFQGCEKDNPNDPTNPNNPNYPDNRPLCEINKTATVIITNTSANPYYIYVDDVLKITLQGKTFQELTVKEGTREFRAEQKSGYILYPTITTATLHAYSCNEYSWVIP